MPQVLSSIYKEVPPQQASEFAKPTSSITSYLANEPLQQHILQSSE